MASDNQCYNYYKDEVGLELLKKAMPTAGSIAMAGNSERTIGAPAASRRISQFFRQQHQSQELL
jgi:hypothetical protein